MMNVLKRYFIQLIFIIEKTSRKGVLYTNGKKKALYE